MALAARQLQRAALCDFAVGHSTGRCRGTARARGGRLLARRQVRRKAFTLTLTLIPTLNLALIRCAALRIEASKGRQQPPQQQQQAAEPIPNPNPGPSPGLSPCKPWP